MLATWLSVAHALTLSETSLGTVHGWTADGALVLEVVTHDHYRPPDADDSSDYVEGRQRHAVVIRGEEELHRWLLANELPEFVSSVPPLRKSEWLAWREQNPIVPAVGASPTGIRLEVRSNGTSIPPAGTGFSTTCLHVDDPGADTAMVDVGLSRSGEGFWSLRAWENGCGIHLVTTTTEAFWGPDGRRVAVLIETQAYRRTDGVVFGALDVVSSRAAPLVAVLAPDTVPAVMVDRVVTAAGAFGLVQKGPAKAARPRSVVYFAPGWKDDASAIAARVPGGATVAPIDWNAAQHVVVALGASAR